jgi:hypothetical protein
MSPEIAVTVASRPISQSQSSKAVLLPETEAPIKIGWSERKTPSGFQKRYVALFSEALNLYPSMEAFNSNRNSPSTQLKREIIVSIQVDFDSDEGSLVEFITLKVPQILRFGKGEAAVWVDVLKKTWGEKYFNKAVASPRFEEGLLVVSPRMEISKGVSPQRKEESSSPVSTSPRKVEEKI